MTRELLMHERFGTRTERYRSQQSQLNRGNQHYCIGFVYSATPNRFRVQNNATDVECPIPVQRSSLSLVASQSTSTYKSPKLPSTHPVHYPVPTSTFGINDPGGSTNQDAPHYETDNPSRACFIAQIMVLEAPNPCAEGTGLRHSHR